jgi:hypothetical protein
MSSRVEGRVVVITGAAYLVDGGSMASKNVTLISD